ncbi:PKD domain-containing protein [Mucilaginibacter sp. CSA2-8R]|uniref:PKD domain-containing protein n=1 Tax=Mucilaginibacter sp. CSA2-8R TaxID=3141542 RepID=UPI00315D5B58
MSLYITSDVTTTFNVEFADGTPIASGTVNANTAYTPINIPTIGYLGSSEVLASKKGIHITSALPIAVYAHIYFQSVSGATLLLPVNALNKNYFSINYTQLSNATFNNPAFSTFAVIATEDETTVRITPTKDIVNRVGNTNIITHAKGIPFEINLQKGDVYQAAASEDLTGTRIVSISTATAACKKIAVFSGSSRMRIGQSTTNTSSDNLFQQVYPTAVWGKNFVTAPLKGRSYDVFRIIYSDLSAKVKVNGISVNPTQTTGDIGFYEFETPNGSNANNIISSDKPIQVAQYAVTQSNGYNNTVFSESVGDPEMIFLPPIEQGLNKITFYSSPYSNPNIKVSYLNVVISAAAAASFTIDGNLYGAANFLPIAGTPYVYAQIQMPFGSHTIAASDSFNAVVYGFGRAESYGFAAGTNLRDLNEYISLGDASSSTGTRLNGCTGTQYDLQLKVPYRPTKIVWDPGDGTAATPSPFLTPIKTDTLSDSTILYTYRFFRKVSYAVGAYQASATVTLPVVSNNDCSADRIINFNFNILDYPVSSFTTAANNCAGSSVQFTDSSNPSGANIVQWIWDFGDGTNSTAGNPNTANIQNPTHTFTQAGNYTVKLTVVNENGCSATAQQTVHVSRNPTASFKISTPDCAGKDITFTDLSVANEGSLSQWTWNFGDGSAVATLTSNTPFTHQYATAGTYNVTLQVTNSSGCTSNIFTLPVVIHELPQANFVLPDACVLDNIKFINTSTIADGTQSLFTYLWNFGDGNISTTKDGVHHYNAAGTYQVTLTVTSVYGCVSTTTQSFFLNGSFPIAKFNIPDQICSSDALTIADQSTVNPGNITRYDIYYDYDRKPTSVVTYDRNHLPIPTDKIFTHNYGLNNTIGYADYHIKIVVYSGSSLSCTAVYDKTVRVYANPLVTLSAPATLCQNDIPVQIAVDTHGFTGQGVFSGGGVTSTGVLDPKKAGPGNHQIVYKFMSDAGGCEASDTVNIKVNAVPLITGKRSALILSGGQITLDPLAVSLDGSTLTYTWSPAAGLSNTHIMSPVASPQTDTQYTLTVSSSNGCSASAVFAVSVLQQPIVYNTFTPNGDGVNDTWNISNLNTYVNATVEVFNRNGDRVYYSIGYPVPWDGRYNGRDLPEGVYYYIINPKNGRQALSGSVTIIR